MRSPELSIVIACYHEAGHLEDSVRQLRATLDASGRTYELIFIDDCSRDATPSIIERLTDGRADCLFVRHAQNVGRGGTVSEGFRLASGRIVGFLDIDLEVHCRHIPDMVAAIENGHDGATAFRQYRVGMSLHGFVRHVLSQGYRRVFRGLFRLPYRDTETGFKFFVREKILPVVEQTRDRGWFWDTEIMVLAHQAGLRVAEVPCPFVRRSDKKSTVRVFRDTWRYLVALRAFRKRLRGEQVGTSGATQSAASTTATASQR